jgi:N-methylhydantoinase B
VRCGRRARLVAARNSQDNISFSVEGEGHKYRPWVFSGGADGTTGSLGLSTDGSVVDLVSKVPYHKIRAGDRIVAHRPSGGG